MPRLGLVIDILAQDRASRAFRSAGTGAQTLTGKMKGLGSALGIGLGTAAIVKFGKDSLTAFGESQRATVELQNALKLNPKLAGESITSFQRLASAIQSKTAADDESVVSGAAVLANFNLTGAQIRGMLPLVVDFARKTGRDVPEASKLIGKALLGNMRALKDLGIEYKLTGDPATDFANITDLLRSKVGGFAEKEATTLPGKLAMMQNRMNDLQEVAGKKLVQAFDFVARHARLVIPAIIALGVALKLASLSFLGPWGLVIGAVVGIVAAIVANWTTVKDFTLGVWDAIVHGIGVALATLTRGFRLWLGFWLGVAGAIVHGAAIAFGWIPGIGPKLKAADTAFQGFKKRILDALDAQVDAFSQWGTHVGRELRTAAYLASRTSEAFRNIRPPAGFGGMQRGQHGFRNFAGGLAVVGERGPEIAFLPRGTDLLNNAESRRVARGTGGLGGLTYVDLRGAVIPGGKEQLARLIVEAIAEHQRRGRSVPWQKAG